MPLSQKAREVRNNPAFTMVNVLTLVVTGVWIFTVIARVAYPALDAVMLAIVSYWFAGQSIMRKNGTAKKSEAGDQK